MNAGANGATIDTRLANPIAPRMLLLLRTYLDMIALRKGPDAVPSSWLVVGISVLLLAISWFVQTILLDSVGEGRMLPALAGYFLALFFYGGVVSAFGFRRRIKQTLASIIACGSIIAMTAVIGLAVLAPLLGSNVARALSLLLLLWAVPVKGHLVAKSIQQHLFVGVTIAIAALIMRLGVETAFVDRLAGA